MTVQSLYKTTTAESEIAVRKNLNHKRFRHHHRYRKPNGNKSDKDHSGNSTGHFSAADNNLYKRSYVLLLSLILPYSLLMFNC